MHEGRPAIANRIVREVYELCNLIAANPEMGEPRASFGVGCRIFNYKRWVIIYRPATEGIEVLRFVDGSRDYDQLF